jgi:MFS family permease
MMSVQTNREPKPFGFRFVAPLALGAALNPINSTMLAVAVVPIADSLHVGVAQAGWLIAGLYLAAAVAQPMMGRLVDLFGPRSVYLASLVFVAVAGLIGWRATSLASLVIARVVLGIGTSGAYPSAMRLFRLEGDRLGVAPPRFAMGVLSLAGVATAAVGPVIGGILTSTFGWRSIFTVNVPLALLIAVLIVLWIPKDQGRKGSFARLAEHVDLAGIGLFTISLLSLMIFLMELTIRPLWPALLSAALFTLILAVYSARRKQPFIDVRMVVHNLPLTVTFLRAGTVAMIVYAVFYGFAQWVQGAVDVSSAKAGLITFPLSAIAAISSVTGVRKGIRAPFVVSAGAALAGCIFLLLIDSATSIWLIAAAVMLFGIPQGTFSTATQAAVYLQSPAEEIGTAAGLQRTAQCIGSIIATSLLALVYGQRATDHGLHVLAIVLGVISAVLLVATVFDPTVPTVESSHESTSFRNNRCNPRRFVRPTHDVTGEPGSRSQRHAGHAARQTLDRQTGEQW